MIIYALKTPLTNKSGKIRPYVGPYSHPARDAYLSRNSLAGKFARRYGYKEFNIAVRIEPVVKNGVITVPDRFFAFYSFLGSDSSVKNRNTFVLCTNESLRQLSLSTTGIMPLHACKPEDIVNEITNILFMDFSINSCLAICNVFIVGYHLNHLFRCVDYTEISILGNSVTYNEDARNTLQCGMEMVFQSYATCNINRRSGTFNYIPCKVSPISNSAESMMNDEADDDNPVGNNPPITVAGAVETLQSLQQMPPTFGNPEETVIIKLEEDDETEEGI
jgi:hypothetical protein